MSIRFFDDPSEARRKIIAASFVLVCADYDGTLTDFASQPDGASLGEPSLNILKSLAARQGASLLILSGRDRGDLLARVNISGVIYAGNHGLEISGPGFVFLEPSAMGKTAELEELTRMLQGKLKDIPGILVEDKGLTVSVHFRNVAPEAWDEVRRQVHMVLAGTDHPFVLTAGEKVFEIRPRVNWNKAATVNWVKERLGQSDALVIYVGDDATDEDAFKAFPDGIGVKVRDGNPSAASYELENQGEVCKLLEWIDDLLARKQSPRERKLVET